MSVDYNKIRELVRLVEKNRLSELSIEEEGLSITIKAEAQGNVVVLQDVRQVEFVERPAAEEAVPKVAAEHLVEIKSPMVGVFYRCPSPDSPPFVEVGERVEVGQTVGLIEAMKVFSEVPTEVAGRVVALPLDNAKLVQQGDVLVVIDTSDVEE